MYLFLHNVDKITFMGSEKTYIVAVSITAYSIVNICSYNETRVFQVNEYLVKT